MPDLLALAALPPPAQWVPSLTDLAKILGVPVAMFLLARFVTRRDKTRDEAAVVVKARNEKEEAKRVATAEAEHERTHKALDEMRGATQHLVADMQALKVEVAHKTEASKETMGRIEGQLSRLIEKFIDRT